MPVERPTFVLYLRPEARCTDYIRSLQATLKYALRAQDLRRTTIQTSDSVGFVWPEKGEA
jgi:hypothetical protein